MNQQNSHITNTLSAAQNCFHKLVELGATIISINIAGRNPVIEIQYSKEVADCYGGGLHLTRYSHGRNAEIYATIIESCQVEWEINRPRLVA